MMMHKSSMLLSLFDTSLDVSCRHTNRAQVWQYCATSMTRGGAEHPRGHSSLSLPYRRYGYIGRVFQGWARVSMSGFFCPKGPLNTHTHNTCRSKDLRRLVSSTPRVQCRLRDVGGRWPRHN